MNGNVKKKDIIKISGGSMLRDYFVNLVDRIENGIGTVKFVTIIFFLILILPLIYVISLPREKPEVTQQDAVFQEFRNKNEARFNSPKKLNESLLIAGFEWKVTSASNVGNVIKAQTTALSDCKAEDGKEFVEVHFEGKNNGSNSINIVSPILFENLSKSYAIFFNSPLCVNQDQVDGSHLFNNQLLKTGESTDLVAFYAVPVNSKNLRLRFVEQTHTGVGDPNEFGYFDLGL